MNAAHHIAAAEAALNTGQPNLAMLHMRRAAELVDVDRAAIKRAYRAARIAASPNAALWFAASDVAESLSRVREGVVAAWREMMPSFARIADAAQADYALAGPSKGGTA